MKYICNNDFFHNSFLFVDWILTNFGTPEPTTMEITTETTTETIPATIVAEGPLESDFGKTIPTIMPTTTEEITEKIIKTCRDTPFGCCHDGLTMATGYNFSGCDPIPKSGEF